MYTQLEIIPGFNEKKIISASWFSPLVLVSTAVWRESWNSVEGRPLQSFIKWVGDRDRIFFQDGTIIFDTSYPEYIKSVLTPLPPTISCFSEFLCIFFLL